MMMVMIMIMIIRETTVLKLSRAIDDHSKIGTYLLSFAIFRHHLGEGGT